MTSHRDEKLAKLLDRIHTVARKRRPRSPLRCRL